MNATPTWGPPVPLSNPVPTLPRPDVTYRSPRRLATALSWTLTTVVVAAGLAMAGDIDASRKLDQFASPAGPVPADRVRSALARADALDIAVSAAMVAPFVIMIIWVHRMYRNLASFGVRDLRYSEGWAIGGWFVPFLNLARPKAIVDDIWRASAPDDNRPWRTRPVPGLLHGWWASWVAAYVLSRVAAVWSTSARSSADMRGALVAQAVATGILMVGAALAMLVVADLTDRHERKATQRHDRTTRRDLRAWLGCVLGPMSVIFALVFFDLGPTSSTAETRSLPRGSIAQQTRVRPGELRVGNCIEEGAPDGSESTEVSSVSLVSCTEGHHSEVVAIVHHAARPGEPYPGEASIVETLEVCLRELVRVAGQRAASSTLDTWLLFPTSMTWAVGDRQIICLAYRADATELEAPIATTVGGTGPIRWPLSP